MGQKRRRYKKPKYKRDNKTLKKLERLAEIKRDLGKQREARQ